MRNIFCRLPMAVNYNNVYSHQDDSTSFDSLPFMGQLNVIADNLAKDALLKAVANQQYIVPRWPFEGVYVSMAGSKITSSIRNSMYHHWGRRVSKELYVARKITDYTGFELIHFEAIRRAMKAFPQGYRTWVTKQVSHFHGTNLMQSHYDAGIDATCPCCGKQVELSSHITQCTDEGRTTMFNESTQVVTGCLYDTGMDEGLVCGVRDYLLACGKKTLQSLLSPESPWQEYAQDHDHLGWASFTEGRIAHSLVLLQRDFLFRHKSTMTVQTWATQLAQHLLSITHRQWTYRNAKLHLKKLDGRTEWEHCRIIQEVREMMLVDPEDMLPCHHNLLHMDFERLGQANSTYRLHWLDQMDSALSARSAVTKLYTTNPPSTPRREKSRESPGLALTKQSNLSKTDNGQGQ